MLESSTQDIYLSRFSGLTKLTTVNDSEGSIFFCVGLSLLKIYTISKQNSSYFRNISKLMGDIINQIEGKSEEDIQYLDLYKEMMNVLGKSSNLLYSIEWLNSCISSKYQKSIRSIMSIGKSIVFWVYQYYCEDTELILSDKEKVLMFVSDFFSVFIQLIKNTDEALYAPNNKEESYIVYLYCNSETQHFFVLHGEDQQNFEEIKMVSLEYYVKQMSIQTVVKLKTDSQERQVKKVIKLAEIMMGVIVDNENFTKAVRDALVDAVEENRGLLNNLGIKRAFEINQVYCEIHRINTCIQLRCAESHCEECVFDIIFKNFNSNNYRVFCPCGMIISPKEVDSIKLTKEYREYSFRKGIV